jgi:hypothetical protein
MKPIETIYPCPNGDRLRSRLEARWAVFFRTLDIPYEYEKEGFVLLGGIKYLPDFWLTKIDVWVEIKPALPSSEKTFAAKKIEALCRESGKNCLLIFGIPSPNEYEIWWFQNTPIVSVDGERLIVRYENFFFSNGSITNSNSLGIDEKTLNALRTARQARFEHGENRYQS